MIHPHDLPLLAAPSPDSGRCHTDSDIRPRLLDLFSGAGVIDPMKQMHQTNIFGQTREEETIDFLRVNEPPEGYFLGFSGGKDSIVLYDLAVKSGVKFHGYYSATGIDAPEVVKFIRAHYPEVIFLRPKESIFHHMTHSSDMYPSRMARWCCDLLKKEPSKKIPLKHRLMGIRAEESTRRAMRPRIDNWKKKQVLYKPIFGWLEWEIWDYIETNKLPYPSLYDEGWIRIGCVICPFYPYAQKVINQERWPAFFRAFEKAMKKIWDKGKPSGAPWREETFEAFLDHWYRGV
jgi:phosphoadenosine phosphosulfate reductase